MRVLVVCNGFPPSGQWGTEFYSHQLATGLAARGAEVEVLHPDRSGTRPRYEVTTTRRYGLAVHELSNAGDPRKRFSDSYGNEHVERAFADLVRDRGFDVVHFTHLLWGLSVRLPRVARAHGARTVVTVTDFGLVCHRGQLVDWRQRECAGPSSAEACARCVREPGRWDAGRVGLAWKRAGVRGAALLGEKGFVVGPRDIEARREAIAAAARDVDHWILPTRTTADAVGGLGLPLDRTTRLVYGLDEGAFDGGGASGSDGSAQGRERDARRRGPVRFAYMSQYMPHKGLRTLVDAARILDTRLPDSVEPWRVDLYGNGSRARHRRYAAACLRDAPRHRVVDHGPFEPLRAPRVLAETDVVLVPSLWRENAPLTVLQARAAGRWLIASDVPGVREVLEDGVHGRLVPPGDARALADAMSAAIRRRAHPAARPATRYAAHLDRIESLYRALCDGPRAPRPAKTAATARVAS